MVCGKGVWGQGAARLQTVGGAQSADNTGGGAEGVAGFIHIPLVCEIIHLCLSLHPILCVCGGGKGNIYS